MKLNKTFKIVIGTLFMAVVLIVLLETLGGRNGVLGFVGFVVALALFRLWKMRVAYLAVCDYAVSMIKVAQARGKKENGKGKNRARRKDERIS